MNPLLPKIYKEMDPQSCSPCVYNHHRFYGIDLFDFTRNFLNPREFSIAVSFPHFHLSQK